MRVRRIFLATAMLALSAPILAKQQDGCSSPVQADTMKPLDTSTTFQCKAGNLTIAQLYEKGWKVVPVFSRATMNPINPAAGDTLGWC